jgi:hypothetical protein
MGTVVVGAMTPPPALLAFSRPHSKRYRLVDAGFEPHPQLDSEYESLDEALQDAVAWLREQPDTGTAAIGVEVSTRSGGWRTVRYPSQIRALVLAEQFRSGYQLAPRFSST